MSAPRRCISGLAVVELDKRMEPVPSTDPVSVEARLEGYKRVKLTPSTDPVSVEARLEGYKHVKLAPSTDPVSVEARLEGYKGACLTCHSRCHEHSVGRDAETFSAAGHG